MTPIGHAEEVHRINHWFDQLPGPVVWITGREVSAYRAAGEAGLLGGMITLTAGVLVRGLPPMIGAGLAAVSVAGFFAWALLRRLVTGRETFVLLEHVWVTMVVAAAYLLVLGQPLASWVDVLCVGLTVFLTAGRVGCLLSGCCHGYPSAIGPQAPPGRSQTPPEGAQGLPGGSPRWPPVRLFPVQLVEGTALAALSALGFAGLLIVPPGGVALGLGVAYAILRLGTELLRGDRPRSRLPVSVASWMALIQLIAVLLLADWWFNGHISPAATVAPGVALVVAVATTLRGRPPPALTLDLVRQLQAAVDAAGAAPVSTPIGAGVIATAARTSSGLELAITGLPSASAARLAELAFGDVRLSANEQATVLKLRSAAEPPVYPNLAAVNGSRPGYFSAL